MAIVDRPYAGNWQPNKRTIVQYTPDALVYINGDTALPGCQTCHHNIDIQQFVTSISVDCGVEPGASNATISMSIPRFYGDSLFRDGNFLIKTALEVHLYARGYFPMKGLTTPNARVGGVDLADVPQYPYYPLFHGVVTSVTHEYSGGYYSASLTCNGMLHFWQHMKISTNGSYFGARPQNSRVRTTLTGHPYTGRTPYAIIYDLYRDTTGAAAGVGFALQSRTNFSAVSSTTRDSVYSLAMRYWERRFRDRIYGLRMHGASGQMFTASQQAYLSQLRTSSQAGRFIAANLDQRVQGRDPYALDRGLLLGLADRENGRVLRQPDLDLLSDSGNRAGLNVTQMQAFTRDIGAHGQVNLFESTYESKLDVATQVTNVTGYEFYQDVDGDLVFKPPLYNLDTSSSRVYRIEPIDIISISFTENEPEATYIIVKAGPFANTTGLVDEAEFGVRSVYVDYKLVAQYGWREQSIETQYFSNAQSAFFAGVGQLDRTNAASNSCSITIPMRPEIRPGYPVYIPHMDCYYYVQSISHAFSFGSQCTTTLNLIARRRKFFAPGTPSVNSGEHGVDTIDLANTALPPKPLQALSTEGVPRLLGFPNVVMALDTQHINPQFFVYGFQVEDSVLSSGSASQRTANRELFLNSFVQTLVSNGLLGLSSSQPPTADPMQGPWTIQRDGFSSITLTRSQLLTALGNFISLRDSARSALPRIRARESHLREELETLRAVENPTSAQTERMNNTIPTELARLAQETTNLQANFRPQTESSSTIEGIREDLRNTTEALRDNPPHRSHSQVPAVRDATRRALRGLSSAHRLSGAELEQVAVFTYLINQSRPQTPGPGFQDTSRDPTGTINESANILDLLNDRKASMSVNLPGYYRYFSASHPDETQQGYEDIDTDASSSEGDTSTAPGAASSGDGGTTGTGTVPDNRVVRNADGTPAAHPREHMGTLSDAERRENTVPFRHTPMSGPMAAAYLREAWRRAHNGQTPSDGVLAILCAQWAHETGRGDHMFNFNFAGIKATRASNSNWDGASVYILAGEAGRTGDTHGTVYRNFRAYGSAIQGAQDYLGVLMRVHGEAIRHVVESPDPARYVQDLVRSHYVDTGNGSGEGYIRSVGSLAGTALREWVPASHSINPDTAVASPTTPRPPTVPTVNNRRGPAANGRQRRTPGRNTSSGPTSSPTPDAASTSSGSRVNTQRQDLETVRVVNASNVEGVNPDLVGDLVSLTTGVPKKGLKVRTDSSRRAKIVPTSQIFTLTFEERGVPRSSNVPTVVFNNGVTATSATQSFRACLTNPPQAEALARTFSTKVGEAGMRNIGQTGGELVTLAVAGISNLKASNGQPIRGTINIANGTPNNRATLNGVDVTATRVGTPEYANQILLEKATALIVEVTQSNQAGLDALLASTATDTTTNRPLEANIQPLRYWTEDITLLFGSRNVPAGLPFHTEYRTHLVTDTTPAFSPVFPVSDAKGYEHYGAYQYGRGLSIEPGGNYERLMSFDPFRYTTPARVEAIVRSISQSPIRRDADGNLVLDADVRRSLAALAGDSDFQNSVGGQIALQWNENRTPGNTDDRTSMIANGLANFILSNRDAVTKLPVNNAAFNLTDLQPMGAQDSCECRGAEADLLLGAYMAGVNEQTFVSVDAPDAASQWVANQMVGASGSWAQAQEAMRGSTTGRGRRSLLDSVAGWEHLIDQGREGVGSAATGASETLRDGLRKLNERAATVSTRFGAIGNGSGT